MAVSVRMDYSAPATTGSPDGSAAFPLNMASAPLPSGATALANSSGNQPAATATATLTSATGRTAFLSGFEWTGSGATGAAVVVLTITGVVGATLSYAIQVAATSAAVPIAPMIVPFNPPLQASATATNIVVSVPSLGTGNVASCVTAHGYMI